MSLEATASVQKLCIDCGKRPRADGFWCGPCVIEFDSLNREAIPYHESGHAVMAVCLGGRVETVEIDERKLCQPRNLIDTKHQPGRTTALLCLAGNRAAFLWHGKGPSCEEDDYVRTVLDLYLSETRFRDDTDKLSDDGYTFAHFLGVCPEASEDELIQLYRQYSNECYAILKIPIVWSAIGKVAAKLVKLGKMSGADVVKAIGKTNYIKLIGLAHRRVRPLKLAVRPAPKGLAE